jgi:ketosteroid isomerase-like protein
MTDADREAIAEAIRQTNAEMLRAGEAIDFEAMMAYWARDPLEYFVGREAMMVNRLRILPTREVIEETYRPVLQGGRGTRYTVMDEYVAVLSPELAVHVAETHYSVADTLGDYGPEYPMTSSTVWVLEDGAWKILHYHQSWSADQPVSEESGR